MREFGYQQVSDVETAVATLATSADARYLGGGTNLVDLMKLGVETPELLIDVTTLPLTDITETADGGVLIGAAVRNSDLAANPVIRQRYPAVAQAVLAGASGQLRNLATTGGNLMQRTRCSYFTDVTKPCNKRAPGSGCPARDGEHHNLAILGASEHCIATSPSDLAVALVALDAVVHVREGDSARAVPLTEFRRLPGDRPDLETTVEPGALITGVSLPGLPIAAASRYRKVRERASYAFAIGSIAAAVEVSGGLVTDCRIAWGAVAAVPWRATRAEAMLRGKPVAIESFAAAADAELTAAEPLERNAYKVALIRNVTVELLAELTGASR
ncbi:MAG: molybdopterin dehydrogenase [Frankiales bacterium]|jgi:xanthine dehydrogenase YagS FAD-binding subunit|nr:molybdopterin dehydrogenase [Frankiales bacterium]